MNSPPGCEVFTLDLPPAGAASASGEVGAADLKLIHKAAPGEAYQGKDGAEKITQLFGDSTTFDFSPYSRSVDIVFVDGAHHYEAARSDSMNALQMVRPGGVVIWHDFANYGDYNDVTRAVLATVPGDQVIEVDNSQLALYRMQDGR